MKKKKQAPTSLQFGSGTRKFFDYLLIIFPSGTESFEEFKQKLNVLQSKEVDTVLDEILE